MVSEATRHVMQANKSKNTKPELRVRAALREAGLPGYRLHWKAAPGKPDILLSRPQGRNLCQRLLLAPLPLLRPLHTKV